MTKTAQHASYRAYWFTWLLLLVLTVAMLGTGYVPLPEGLVLSLLILAMLVKASLIGAYFMHLRFEKIALVVTVTLGILATAAALFVLIAFDGVRILRLAAP